MTPFEEQFLILKGVYESASMQQLPNGTALIAIPNFPLPEGWSKDKTRINFLAPVGYPLAKPDCFWADIDLRLRTTAMPQATNLTAIPGTNETKLWFSWHAGQWNPNRDNLLTFVRVIESRLKEIR